MAYKLPEKEAASFEGVLISQSYELAALLSLLEKKGILTKTEILEEIKSLQRETN